MEIVVDGKLVHYGEYTSSLRQRAKLLLILHGWGQEGSGWQGVAQLLASEVRVVVPDLPGFGRSQGLSSLANVPEYSLWVAHFVKQLKLKDFILMGHSFGGQIAAYGVAQGVITPEKLILVSPALKRYPETALPLARRWFQTLSRLKPWLPKRMVNRISTASDYGLASEELQLLLQKVIRFDVSHLLPAIPCPTVCIWGEKDAETLGTPKQLAHRIPQGRLRIIYGGGHNLQVESPELLALMVRHFMELFPHDTSI